MSPTRREPEEPSALQIARVRKRLRHLDSVAILVLGLGGVLYHAIVQPWLRWWHGIGVVIVLMAAVAAWLWGDGWQSERPRW